MALREVFAKLAFDWDPSKLVAANRGVDGLVNTLEGAAGVLAGGALVEGIKHFAEQLDVFDDLSAQTHVATGDLQELGYAAKISGSSAEEMFASLSLLQKALGRADAATSPQAEALEKLGIKAKDASGEVRDLNDILPEIYENFNNLKSGSDKAQVATALLGRAGVKLIPTLERGAEGFKAIHDELEEFGGVVSEDTIAQAGEFRDNLVRLDTAFFALKGQLASAVFPQLSRIITLIGHGVGRVADFAHGTTLAEHATTALSVALAVKLGAALAPYLKQGLKFAAIFFAIDDVLGFLEGKDSEIGFLLNKVFGPGSDAVVRDWVNRSISELQRFRDDGGAALEAFESKHTSMWTKVLAAAGVGWRDLISGFPVFRAEAEETWQGVNEGFQTMVLDLERAWNRFIESMAGLVLPDFVVKLLKIDTSAVENRVSDRQNKRQAARERSDAAFFGQDAGAVRGRASEGLEARKGRTVSAVDDAAFKVAASVPTLLLPGAQQIGPLRADLPAPSKGNFVQVNHNAPAAIIQVPPGTSAQIVKAAGAAAVSAIQGERRAALEALKQAQPDQ